MSISILHEPNTPCLIIVTENVRRLDNILNRCIDDAATDVELDTSLQQKLVIKRWLSSLPDQLLNGAALFILEQIEVGHGK
jgi:hypothetical protein